MSEGEPVRDPVGGDGPGAARETGARAPGAREPRACPLSCEAGLFDLIPVAVLAYELEGLRIVAANDAAAALYGWTREELLTLTLADVRPPEEVPELLSVLAREGTSRRVMVEARHRRKDGASFAVQVTSRPVSLDGRAARLAVVLDVSARKAAEERARDQGQRAALLAGQLPAIVWATDRNLRITASLGAGLPVLGLGEGELCGRPLAEVLGPGGDVYLDFHRRALAGESVSYETLWGDRAYQVHLEPRRDANEATAGVVGMALDVTDQRHVHEQARQAESRLRILAGQIPAVLWSTDRNLRFTWSDGAGLATLGLRPNEVVGLPLSDYFRHGTGGYPPIRAHEAALLGETVTFETEFAGRIFHCHVEPLLDANGAVAGTIGAALDVTERKHAERRALHQAEYDALTDLPNRLLFDRQLRVAVERSSAGGDRLAVVFLDLDHFKSVNDALGHLVGDELLRGAAGRLREAVRFGDVVARVGGDEFLLLLPGVRGREDSTHVAEKVLAVFRQPFVVQGRELSATASLGIATFPDDGADPETLVRHADAAMYRAKQLGRSGFQHYHPDDSAMALERVSLDGDLRRALGGHPGLLLHFQPQVRLADGRVTGLEALVRWAHPVRGLLLPSDFLAVAEELGLLLELGSWVLGAAARAARGWAEGSGGDVRPRVAVNVHSFELRERHFLHRVEKLLAATGCDPSLLEIEVTEAAAIGNLQASTRALRGLKELGFRLAIDDFGTGHSSLSYLKQLPVHRVKIDRSFVRDVASDGRDRAIVAAIVALGHALGLSVVAEGVETPEQEACLLEAGCDEAQGYLIAAPVPEAEAEALLRREAGWWRSAGPRSPRA